MRVAHAACCAVIVLLSSPPASASGPVLPLPLSLDDAMRRTIEFHPDLKLWRQELSVAQAQVDQATQRPALRVVAEVENALGSGSASSFGGAELTFSLASVLERGDKQLARVTVARSRIDALAISRETRRLDVLAEVARRYLDMVSAQTLGAIGELDRIQRERTVQAAQRRVSAGAAPRSQLLAAQAALMRSALDVERAQLARAFASRRLALLWGEREPAMIEVEMAPLDLPQLDEFAVLAAKLEHTPELQQFASEQRQREARIALARTAATPDLDWQVGVRRLQADSDWGMVASVTIPLGSAARSEPEIRQAQAQLEALGPEMQSRELSLYATLAEAHGRYEALAQEARQLRSQLIPSLVDAEKAAAEAYTAGALSYLEWAQLQSETTAARRQQLNAGLDAQRALIEIQRLTGEPMLALEVAAQESTR